MKKFLIFALMIFIGMQASVSTTQSHQKSAKEKMKAFLSTTRGKLIIGIGSLVGVGAGIAIPYFVWIKKQNAGAIPKSDQHKSEQAQQEEKRTEQQAEKEKRIRQKEVDEKREMEKQEEEEKQRKIIAVEKLHELYATEEVSKNKDRSMNAFTALIVGKYQEACDAYKNGIFLKTIDIVNGALKDIKEEHDAQASKQYQRNYAIVTSLQSHIVGNKLQWNCDGVLVDTAKSNATDLVVNVHGVEASDVEGMRTTLNEWEEYKKHGYKKVIFTFLKK